MTNTYKIKKNAQDDYDILQFTDDVIVTRVQTNIRTREKAQRAKEIWERREALKHD